MVYRKRIVGTVAYNKLRLVYEKLKREKVKARDFISKIYLTPVMEKRDSNSID